ncbi:unnamed protein product [Linum trigynum]|uniref:Uncharacterized protein n=1 Tax=Linum trigynum TaxID=586398 RepID=A0AAV2D8A5_9ROSI
MPPRHRNRRAAETFELPACQHLPVGAKSPRPTLPPSPCPSSSSPADARSPVSETPAPPSPYPVGALSISVRLCRSIHPWRKNEREGEVVWYDGCEMVEEGRREKEIRIDLVEIFF